jgi:hypothetical protein
MAATFGDIIGQVDPHLDAAITFPAMALDGDTALAAGHEIHRLALTLSRYLRDVAPHDVVEAVTSRDLPEWLRAAVDAREALQLAAASLRPKPGPVDVSVADPPGPVAAHLSAATTFLSAGRDLLHTHFATEAEGAQIDHSEWAPIVRSEASARAVLEEVARWLGKLTLLGDALSIACAVNDISPAPENLNWADARPWLLSAGSALQKAKRSNPESTADTGLLMAIPANSVPDRRPPQPSEAIDVLTEGIEASATRLRALAARTADQAAWSTDSWKWTATAAAIISHLSEHMLRSLAGRAGKWQWPPDTGPQLHATMEASGEACTQWQKVVIAWGDLGTESRGLTAPGITDTSDLVLRVGRLAFTDPDWTPSQARRTGPLRDPADLAPDAAHAAVLVGALHQATDALARVAAAALRDVSVAGNTERLYVPTRTLPARYDIPYPYWHAPPGTADAVLSAYRAAAHASGHAATALGAVAFSINAPCTMLAPQRAVAVPVQRAAAGRAAAGSAEDTGTTRKVAAPSIPGVVTQPPAGPVERALREIGSADPFLLLRAKAIDKAGRKLITEAGNESAGTGDSGHVRNISAPAMAAESFPSGPRASVSLPPQPAVPIPSLRARSQSRRHGSSPW